MPIKRQMEDLAESMGRYMAPDVVNDRFNERERFMIEALIFWAARNNDITELTMSDLLAARFEEISIDDIDRKHFDAMVEYLIDFRSAVN